METHVHSEPDSQVTQPWNKGKLTGAKPPLRPKHVWAVRTRLQLSGRYRDLAMFNLAIDSKLRGCDVVSLKIVDVAPHGYALDRASVRQRKTGRRLGLPHYLPRDPLGDPLLRKRDDWFATPTRS